jgi:hypothetical protein
MKWREWEGLGLDIESEQILYTPGHTDDVTDLIAAIQQTGWTDRRGAIAAAHILNLRTGWYGYIPGEYQPHACDDEGMSLFDDTEAVEIAMPLTWVVVE